MARRIAVVGSRAYPRLVDVVHYVASLPQDVWIVSGGARGVDFTAAAVARRDSHIVLTFPPRWVKYGRRAGFIRNQLIVDAADEVVAFWDGKSRGTMDTVERARRAGKAVEIHLAGG